MVNRRFILFAFFLSALALWFVLQQNNQKPTLALSTLKSTDDSWQVFNSTTWQFDKTRQQNTSVTKAKTVFHNDATAISDFTEPRIALIQTEQTLFIKSQTGQSFKNGDLVLKDNVRLMQFNQPLQALEQAQQNKTLKTQFITYNSIKDTISSDQPVEIIQSGSVTTGTGLDVDIKKSHYRLLSEVKGKYQTAQSANTSP